MNLKRPIVFFDIESTGTDVATDRIISIALIKQDEHNQRTTMEVLVNPGVPIKPEASATNGFTDEKVRNLEPFKVCAAKVQAFVAGCDIGGYNLRNFDVPLLWEEFHRCGINWELAGVAIVDVANIFRKKEERTLTAAVKFYLGREMENAHDAMADIEATADVLVGQMIHYRDLDKLDMQELAAYSAMDDRVDLAGKIVKDASGEAVYNFGKDKGKSVRVNPGFGRWMLDKDFSENTKQVVRKLIGSR